MDHRTSDLRLWLHDARHGNPWRDERPRVPARIDPLVRPLRYDILVRRAYFEHFAAHREQYDEDFDAYAAAAREHPYFLWFRHVMCPSWQPHVLADERAFDAAWRERLRRSAELHASFERDGFDRRHPITLYAGVRVRPARSGRRVAHRLFAGDGNHRLALLLAAGRTEVLPGEYRVRRFLTLTPSDTTPVFTVAFGVDEAGLDRVLAAPVAAGEAA